MLTDVFSSSRISAPERQSRFVSSPMADPEGARSLSLFPDPDFPAVALRPEVGNLFKDI